MSGVTASQAADTIIGEPEVVERRTEPVEVDALAAHPSWKAIKAAATELRTLQEHDGSVPDAAAHPRARALVEAIRDELPAFAELFPHDAEYLEALGVDLTRWADGDFAEPDFLDSLQAFQPQLDRVDGLRHLVLFPMYTQNGSSIDSSRPCSSR